MKVMIVEDEAVTALCLEMELRSSGFDVCPVAFNGELAVMIAHEEKPDVILMDINLPGAFDGIEAAKRINMNRRIPVIFLSGYSDEKVKKTAEPLNPEGFLQKPILPVEICEILSMFFKKAVMEGAVA